MADDSQLDRIDEKMLAVLAADGRIALTELASRVGLSKTPCQVRLKRLIADGYIRGFRAVIDPGKLGRDHIAFVEVKLSDTREPALMAFNEAVRSVAAIEQCHLMAGAFDYLLKIRSRNMADYRRILGEVVSSLPHVASTSTHIAMEAIVDEA